MIDIYESLTLKINFRVIKKNLIPDSAMVSRTISSKNRFVSVSHDCDGKIRKILIGFFDSSLMHVAENETTDARNM